MEKRKRRARNTDPQTSRDAADSIEGISGRQRRKILATIWRIGPATDEEILAALPSDGVHVSPSGARTRRSELVDDGIVFDTGQRKRLCSGRWGIVWQAK